MAIDTGTSQQTRKDLESQIARLNKIGIALSSEHNLNRLLEMIVREARGLPTPTAAVCIFARAISSILSLRRRNRWSAAMAKRPSSSRFICHSPKKALAAMWL
ncbi:MAG: hypothetical protein Q9P14_12455 [candidate division KSB1 bacterium]|nr:hypothetical protein [candidate division KSB1 bacterium]